MPEFKLDRLPDRTPAKLTVTVSPDLARALADYRGLPRHLRPAREGRGADPFHAGEVHRGRPRLRQGTQGPRRAARGRAREGGRGRIYSITTYRAKGRRLMSMIARFTASRDGYHDTIRTLTINAKARIIPNDDKTGDNPPDYRFSSGRRRSACPGRPNPAARSPRPISAWCWMTRSSPSPSAPPCSRRATRRGWCGVGRGRSDGALGRWL